jgi:hypothetical protein
MRLVLAAMAVVTACDPYVDSRVLLTPSPSTVGPDSVGARAAAIVDTVARRHGLRPNRWPHGCMIGSSEGARQGTWGGAPLWVSVCAAEAPPIRVEIRIKEPGFGWSARGDSLRHELLDTLRVRFGSAAVAVDSR